MCLLEIGTWEVLINSLGQKPAGFFLAFIGSTQEDFAGKIEQLYPNEQEANVKADGAWFVTGCLVQAARYYLPSRMGTAFSKVVIDCLTCLDADGTKTWNVDFQHGDVLISKKHLQELLMNQGGEVA